MDGYVVPARDCEAIVERLEMLVAKSGLLEAMSANARQNSADYTLEKYGERLIACFRKHHVLP
jgi:glycosyltransferase involved in cell wall biosynthesis